MDIYSIKLKLLNVLNHVIKNIKLTILSLCTITALFRIVLSKFNTPTKIILLKDKEYP